MRRLTPVALTLVLAGCTVDDPSDGRPTAPPDPAATAKTGTPPPLLDPRDRPKESPDELLSSGLRAEEADDLPAAARYYDRALGIDPKNRTALLSAARVSLSLGEKSPPPHNARHFLKAAERMRSLRGAYPDLDAAEKQALAVALYNEACAYALTGETARVVPTLEEARAAGFDDLSQLDLDADLDSVRKDPAFRAVIDRMEREHAARVLAAAKPFPFDFKLPDVDGKTVSLDDYRGKVLVVDFWGTWCLPCRKELPHLMRLLKAHESEGLAIVGLNYEQAPGEAGREVIRHFVRETHLPYPCLIGDQKTQALVPDFDGFPTTLVLDREGKVHARLTGYQPFGALEALVAPLLTSKDAPRAPKP